MPVNTANQGIPEQQGADPANLPGAQVSWDGIMENRLAQRYASIADRTARNPAPNENEISLLADVDRAEIFNTADWVSLIQRAWYATPRIAVGADQTLTPSSTALQNVTAILAALPVAGTFGWRTAIYADATTVSDIQFAYTIPAGATMLWGGYGGATTVAAGVGDGVWGPCRTVSDSAMTFGTSGTGTGNTQLFVHEGEITMGGTAGNLQLRSAQANVDATAIVIRARTKMWVWRIF